MRMIENKCSNCVYCDTCRLSQGVVVWRHCEKFIPTAVVKEAVKLRMIQEAEKAEKVEARPYARRWVKKVDRSGKVLDMYRTTYEAAQKCGLTRGRVYSHCAGQVKDPFSKLDYTFLWEDENLEDFHDVENDTLV